MTLAQVVYQVSTDGDFAAQMRTDPIAALAVRGVRLSKEELSFLGSVLKSQAEDFFRLDGLLKKAKDWM